MVAIIKIPNLPPDSTKERLAQKHVPKIALRGEGGSLASFLSIIPNPLFRGRYKCQKQS